MRAGLDPNHLRPVRDGLAGHGAVDPGGRVAVDHLQQLQHGLVVLMLVGEQHLVDEAVLDQRIAGVVELDRAEHVERPRADLVHIGAQLIATQDR